MNAKSLVVIGIFGIATPALAAAPTIDQLIANPSRLNAEMDRCKHLGMAANDDPRCQTAWKAENKRFFGNGTTTYTPSTPQIYPNAPVPNLQPPKPSPVKSPNG